MRTSLLVALTAPLLIIQGCPSAAPADTPLSRLLDSVEQRLDVSEQVALSKWDSRQPVQAPERERQVINQAQSQATRFGIDAQRAGLFFSDQIEANKLLQYHALSRWHAAGSAPQTQRIDLAKQLRPQLDRLQEVLLEELAEFDRHRPEPCTSALAQAIEKRKKSSERSLALIRATAHLCPAI
ncbi:chorismate mutase [Pseudomonas sp. P66]|uniref:chorismate mutase n=1 Tax=Pseudomonas arcuscaelestis TaxID=2710591 RepID=A0ABS2BQN7_9PSED|nr:chorismate mutase [Pseudomonas arcuscaelestis]MBM3110943.1 chorismate mutase [Pseudomonas arcuscaelestis]MBM5455951.1 chorismate mutase [Pseudomonas arcuscaelestis]